MSIAITFVTAKGERVEAHGEPGVPLLEVAQAAGMPVG